MINIKESFSEFLNESSLTKLNKLVSDTFKVLKKSKYVESIDMSQADEDWTGDIISLNTKKGKRFLIGVTEKGDKVQAWNSVDDVFIDINKPGDVEEFIVE